MRRVVRRSFTRGTAPSGGRTRPAPSATCDWSDLALRLARNEQILHENLDLGIAGSQGLANLIGRGGPVEIESLNLAATLRIEEFELLGGFHALGQDRNLKALS